MFYACLPNQTWIAKQKCMFRRLEILAHNPFVSTDILLIPRLYTCVPYD